MNYRLNKLKNEYNKLNYLFTMLFLTRNDLLALTDRTHAAAQIRWLEARDWRFEIG